jgi:hypothetical protein
MRKAINVLKTKQTILVVLFTCLLALTSVKMLFKLNKSSLRIHDMSVLYASKDNFNDSKYKA